MKFVTYLRIVLHWCQGAVLDFRNWMNDLGRITGSPIELDPADDLEGDLDPSWCFHQPTTFDAHVPSH